MHIDGTALPSSGNTTRGTQLRNKVPEITAFFWIVKVLSTTVGETAADFLDTNLGLGLTATTVIMAAVLAIVLALQLTRRRYVPALYWASVVMISIVGTLITDNLTTHYEVSLVISSVVFAVLLALAFAAWYASEKTLSIHSITTRRRECFYWLVVLCTFALGTAVGDLMAERLALGYWESALIFGGAIGAISVAASRLRLDAILAFWLAYIITRPLGASTGDYLSQRRHVGGLGLGTTVTSGIFLGAIVVVVTFLTVTRFDRIGAGASFGPIDVQPGPPGDGRRPDQHPMLELATALPLTPLLPAPTAAGSTGGD